MKKIFLLISISLSVLKTDAHDIYTLNSDTTISGTWNLNGKILRLNAKVGGTGTITNAKIEANYFVQIFDTTIVIGSGCMMEKFSAMWYGASQSNPDNYLALQASINACNNRSWVLYIPGQSYTYSQSLLVASPNGSNFNQSRIRIKGDDSFWPSQGGTTLNYTGNSYALGLQLNKGSEISNLHIRGGWVSPGGNDSVYYKLSIADYTNQAATGNGQGLWIDPIVSENRSGSTGLFIHDIFIEKFSTLLRIGNSWTQNADIIRVDNIQFGDGKIGLESSQDQEKGNKITGVYSWGRLHTLISIGNYGQFEGANYYFDGGNIAGKVIRLLWVNGGGYFSSYLTNYFCESLGTIGNISTGLPMNISNSMFDFAYTSMGENTLLTSNNQRVKFDNCSFRYYGASSQLKMSGSATFENVYSTGTITGLTNKAFINYNNGAMTVTGSVLENVTDTITSSPVKLTIKTTP